MGDPSVSIFIFQREGPESEALWGGHLLRGPKTTIASKGAPKSPFTLEAAVVNSRVSGI